MPPEIFEGGFFRGWPNSNIFNGGVFYGGFFYDPR